MTGWVRPSACAAGDCIEVCETTDGRIAISRHPANERADQFLTVTRAEWDAFTAGIKNGEFDQLGDTP